MKIITKFHLIKTTLLTSCDWLISLWRNLPFIITAPFMGRIYLARKVGTFADIADFEFPFIDGVLLPK